jgi:site-specific DNA-methyltransferase (adenine-specific)
LLNRTASSKGAVGVELEGGVAIRGHFPDQAVLDAIVQATGGNVPLTICDPPYGNIVADRWDKAGYDDVAFAAGMVEWTKSIEAMSAPGAALYVWGGVGRPLFRPFYRYLFEVERQTGYRLANHITWAKRRAYGLPYNYLFTREELAYLHLGPDIRKPRCFSAPLLEQKRGYAGYDPKHPAKSEYLRRTNVWTDVTEILSGKVHIAQKPQRLHEIPIEVHTHAGEWVLDPFAGSGTTALAARKLGRRFVVIEEDEEMFEKMVAILRGEMPRSLPSARRPGRVADRAT